MMGNATGGHVVLSLDTGKLLRPSHVTVATMTAAVVARVNYLGREEKLLLTFQNRKGEEIGENLRLHNSVVTTTDEDRIEFEGHPDTADTVTGVESPYKEYVDKWNEIPEDSIEREAQVGDVVNQGITENTEYTSSNEELVADNYDSGTDEYSLTPQRQEAQVIAVPTAENRIEPENNRPTRVQKPVERLLTTSVNQKNDLAKLIQ